jgi:hypothetical protein
MTVNEKARNVLFVLLGVAALVLKGSLVESSAGGVHRWGGNLAASFACYFLASIPPIRTRHRKLVAAASALVAVEAFEATNGFGVMSNVYDPIDFAANALGVGLALMIDASLGRLTAPRTPKQGHRSSPPAT